jgi:hypothetical protein
MKKSKPRNYSRIREQLRREDAEAMAKLTPGERLKMGLEFSDFCIKLAAAGRKERAGKTPTGSRRTT